MNWNRNIIAPKTEAERDFCRLVAEDEGCEARAERMVGARIDTERLAAAAAKTEALRRDLIKKYTDAADAANALGVAEGNMRTAEHLLLMWALQRADAAALLRRQRRLAVAR